MPPTTRAPAPIPLPKSQAFVRRYRSIPALKATRVIHLSGRPGSGKSYLAAILADALSLPHLSIDAEREAILSYGEDWPADDTQAWVNLEDKINAARACIVETSGLHGNDALLLSGRTVLRIRCQASEQTRRKRLQERTTSGYFWARGRPDYVRRLLALPEPIADFDVLIRSDKAINMPALMQHCRSFIEQSAAVAVGA